MKRKHSQERDKHVVDCEDTEINSCIHKFYDFEESGGKFAHKGTLDQDIGVRRYHEKDKEEKKEEEKEEDNAKDKEEDDGKEDEKETMKNDP